MCTSHFKIHANIVLAGDPKLLSAITKSEEAKGLGFSISLMDRLLALDLYKRNKATGKFNETYITQLVENYRSHKAILDVPNELFYGNQMKSKAMSGTHLLKNIIN